MRTDNKESLGRVLRVKQGYNPNSSSIGSSIPLFLALAGGAGAVVTLLLGLLDGVGRAIRKQEEKQTGSGTAVSSSRDEGSA